MKATDLEHYRLELITEHQADIAALDRLIQRERNKTVGSSAASDEPLGMARYRRSVAALVKEAVMKLHGNFTRKHIAKQIAKTYPAITVPPTRRIAVELWKLAKAGEIELVKEGRGRTPAIYKRK